MASPASSSPGPLASPLGLTSEQFVAASGFSRPVALELYRKVFRGGIADDARAPVHVAAVAAVMREESPEGTVVKFMQRVPAKIEDGRAVPPAVLVMGELAIESVLIPMIGKRKQRTYTLCVSSQVGCAMGCAFCETAQMGLIRSLSPAEIVGQWFAATHALGHKVSNIVFMGMGEPMDNYDNVVQAIAVLKDHNGPGVPISKVTVSTVGRVDGIRRLAAQVMEPTWHRLGLAISLNAPSDAVRSTLMPVNKAMPMSELREALIDFPVFGGGKLCMEYVLIPGVNDSPGHAAQVAEFVGPINERFCARKPGSTTPRVVVNVIPYNPRRQSPWPAPTEETVERFMNDLIAAGVYAKRRRTKGRDLMGACGQLGTAEIRRRKLVPLTTAGLA